MSLAVDAGCLATGYLCGSIPFGVLITRWRRGMDVRAHGSGNIGATNVARVAGKGLGVLVLALDALKGAIPVFLVSARFSQTPWLHAGVGLAAFLGHVFPIWLRFRGGKGVATALGILAALVPWAAAAGVLVYAVCLARYRVSSIGSLAGGFVAVGVSAAMETPVPYVATSAALFLLMLFTHRGNIRRLLRREERRL